MAVVATAAVAAAAVALVAVLVAQVALAASPTPAALVTAVALVTCVALVVLAAPVSAALPVSAASAVAASGDALGWRHRPAAVRRQARHAACGSQGHGLGNPQAPWRYFLARGCLDGRQCPRLASRWERERTLTPG